ncbi:MAG: hypothetical protein AAF570_18820 [Bacteroidota bacterium]
MLMIKMEKLASVPWPRGLCFANGKLLALGRGRPRGAGGPHPSIDDRAGTIFEIETSTGNIREFISPTDPPFHFWNRKLPNYDDIETDRPYAGLAWDANTQNLFICGFSGIDKPSGAATAFRKNATDAVLRYDFRVGKWFEVERHDGSVVPELIRRSITLNIPNYHYPSSTGALPQGWLNGPNGLTVHGSTLFVAGIANHSLVAYDLSPLIKDPAQGYLQGKVLRKDTRRVTLDAGVRDAFDAPSAIAIRDTYVYVSLRTPNLVLRFPLSGDYSTARVIAQFPSGVGLIDMKFGKAGDLYVSSKRKRIWKVGKPDPDHPFQGDASNVYAELPGNCANIALGKEDRLYVCCNVDGGAIYRQIKQEKVQS